MKQSPVLKTMGTLPEMNPNMACECRIQPHTVNAPCATIARHINASDPCLIRLADPSRGILRITEAFFASRNTREVHCGRARNHGSILVNSSAEGLPTRQPGIDAL